MSQDTELNDIVPPNEAYIEQPIRDEVKADKKGMSKGLMVKIAFGVAAGGFVLYSVASMFMPGGGQAGQNAMQPNQTGQTTGVTTPNTPVYATATNPEYKAAMSATEASAANAASSAYARPIADFTAASAANAASGSTPPVDPYAPVTSAPTGSNTEPPTTLVVPEGVRGSNTDAPGGAIPAVQDDGTPKHDARTTYLLKIKDSMTSEIKSSSTPGVDVERDNSQATSGGYADNSGQAQQAVAAVVPEMISTGDMHLGYTTTSLNSLVPQTPVRVVGVGGQFNGAVYMGYAEPVNDQYMVLAFTTMTWRGKTYPIAALGINPRHDGAEFADQVNSKKTSRNALLAALAFTKAIGAAKATEGSVTQSATAIEQSVTNTKKYSMGDLGLIGLSGAAGALEPELQNYIASLKPEIKVSSNKEIAILFVRPLLQR